MLGKFSPSRCFSANRKLPKVFGAPRIQEYVTQFFGIKYNCCRVHFRVMQYILHYRIALSAHTPQMLGGDNFTPKLSPPKYRGLPQENAVKQVDLDTPAHKF